MKKFTKYMGNLISICVITTVTLLLVCITGLALLGAIKVWGAVFGYE